MTKRRITKKYLLSKGFVFDSHGDYDLDILGLGKLTISLNGYQATIEDNDGEMCVITKYPIIYEHQLEALLKVMTKN